MKGSYFAEKTQCTLAYPVLLQWGFKSDKEYNEVGSMTRALTSLKLGLNRVNMLQTENPIRLEEMEMR
ncbi:Uncharacterised protein [Vibrio cholerae]|nr:Uncharacterised protein [Vibrio cholerae]